MTAVTVIGLVASLFIKAYPLNMAMDEDWGLEREVKTVIDGNVTEKAGAV